MILNTRSHVNQTCSYVRLFLVAGGAPVAVQEAQDEMAARVARVFQAPSYSSVSFNRDRNISDINTTANHWDCQLQRSKEGTLDFFHLQRNVHALIS